MEAGFLSFPFPPQTSRDNTTNWFNFVLRRLPHFRRIRTRSRAAGRIVPHRVWIPRYYSPPPPSQSSPKKKTFSTNFVSKFRSKLIEFPRNSILFENVHIFIFELVKRSFNCESRRYQSGLFIIVIVAVRRVNRWTLMVASAMELSLLQRWKPINERQYV